jgi:hypothetical protein
MKDFKFKFDTENKIEVGGRCANGAQVLAVYMDEAEGVVLATWRQEFITWVFPTNDQRATAHGNYFMFNKNEEGDEQKAFQRARADFIRRATKLSEEF